ncbi:MAG: hypothetical protein HY825_13705 [Acidobacteria bacterium]|nr:hypothetical protein [Acidobacteriota bacterium]
MTLPPWRLSEGQREELLSILGRDDAKGRGRERIVAAIEEVLSGFSERDQRLDHGPRPCDVREALTRLATRVTETERALAGLDWRSAASLDFALRRRALTARQVRESLSTLRSTAARLSSIAADMESRHRPTRHALRITILALESVYDAFACADLDDAPGEPSLDPGRLKQDFVKAALAAGRIKAPQEVRKRAPRRLVAPEQPD